MNLDINFNTNELRLMEVLKDGQRHTKYELRAVLQDELSENKYYLPRNITGLRKKLKPVGYDIVCEYRNRTIHYRIVRPISTT